MPDYSKTSSEVLNYTFDWTAETTDAGDTIASSSVIVPTGLTLVSDTNDTTTATCFISGGRHGVTYVITNRIVTDGGTTNDQSFTLVINDYPSVQ